MSKFTLMGGRTTNGRLRIARVVAARVGGVRSNIACRPATHVRSSVRRAHVFLSSEFRARESAETGAQKAKSINNSCVCVWKEGGCTCSLAPDRTNQAEGGEGGVHANHSTTIWHNVQQFIITFCLLLNGPKAIDECVTAFEARATQPYMLSEHILTLGERARVTGGRAHTHTHTIDVN